MLFISLKKAIKKNQIIVLYLVFFFLSGCARMPIKQWEYKPTGTTPRGALNVSEFKSLKIAVMYPKDERKQIGSPGNNWQRNDEYMALEQMEKKRPLIYPDLLLIGRSIVDELRSLNLFKRVDWAPKITKDYDFKIDSSLNSLMYKDKKVGWYDYILGCILVWWFVPLLREKKIDGVLTAYVEDPTGTRGPLRTISIQKKAASGDLYYDYALPSFAPQIARLVIQEIQNMMGSHSGVQFVRSRAQRFYQLQDAELIAFEKELQRRVENKLINDSITKNLARAFVVKTSLLETLRQLEDKYMEEEQKLQDQEFKKYVDTTYNAWKTYTAQKNKEMLVTVLSIGAAFTSAALSAYVNLEAQQAAGLGQYNIADTLSMTASTISALGSEALQRGSMTAEVASVLRGEIVKKVEEDLGESLKKFRKIRGTIKEVHDQFIDTYLDETASFDDVMAGRWPKK